MKYLITLLISGILLFLNADTNLQAQTCTGSVTCCQQAGLVPSPPGCSWTCGNPAEPGCTQCTWTQGCLVQGGISGCGFSGGICGHQSCAGGFVMSGQCIYTPPNNTPTPQPSSTPGGGGSTTCSGPGAECRVGISNCGEIGKVPGSGSCGNGGMCCVNAGGGDPTNCTVTLSPSSFDLYVGSPAQTVTAIVSGGSGTVTNVEWTRENQPPFCFGHFPPDDNTFPYQASLNPVQSGFPECTGFSQPYNRIRAYVTMSSGASCANSADVFVRPATPPPTPTPPPANQAWFQVNNGALISANRVSDPVPSGNFLINGINGSDEAIVNYYPILNIGNGAISPGRWNVSGQSISQSRTYAEMYEQIPATAQVRPISGMITPASLSGATPDAEGIEWYRHDSNANLTQAINIASGRKVVLFVNGNLNLNNTVTLGNINSSFFMVIVSGNITVSPLVGTTPTTVGPQFSGIFHTNQQFITSPGSSNSTSRLNIRGSVVALGGVNLQRNTGTSNPAESFTFSPELIINFPSSLSLKRAFWKEVAP